MTRISETEWQARLKQAESLAEAGTEYSSTLRVWAESDESEPVLARWLVSGNPSLSLSAISLIARTRTNLESHADHLIGRFNAQLSLSAASPEDGLDAATGRHSGWAPAVYSTLKAYVWGDNVSLRERRAVRTDVSVGREGRTPFTMPSFRWDLEDRCHFM
ncbi:hypothetical protein WJ542_11700 [Paraburkholderia sp. B3]|uniref:hypothetical protein n=1 Tax=Paraburkholderia sp. B3 TaxID=3134791 RepID=UPI003981D395